MDIEEYFRRGPRSGVKEIEIINLTLRIPKETHRKLRAKAEKEGISVSKLIRAWILKYLKEK